MNTDDSELLARFVAEKSEDAFADLVRRHLNMVWSTARRITGDEELARDVAQTVFADLARKARWLPRQVIVAGWLHRAACHASRKALRTNIRRSQRERTAMELQQLESPSAEEQRATETVLPLLDEALDHLGDAERHALVLRFFAGRSLDDIGREQGVSGDAAQKRVARAVERLRSHFRRRGVLVPSATIITALGGAAAQSAPAGLVGTVAASSLATIAAVGPVSALTYLATGIKTQLITMKVPLLLTTLTVTAVIAPLAIQQRAIAELRAETEHWQEQIEPLSALREENQRLQARRLASEELAQLRRDQEELRRLRAEMSRLEGAGSPALRQEWESANAALYAAQSARDKQVRENEARVLREQTIDALKNLGLAARIFATDNNDRLPESFEAMKNEIGPKLPGGLSLERFEFVPHARIISEMEPQLFLFREKEPRQLPDGRWVRGYCFVDGSVQERTSDTADFSAWERSTGGIVTDPQIPEPYRNHQAYRKAKP